MGTKKSKPKKPSLTTEDELLCDRFGRAGEFVVYGSRLRTLGSASAVAAEVGVSAAWMARILRRINKDLTKNSSIKLAEETGDRSEKVKSGLFVFSPGGHKLSPDGERLLSRLEKSLRRCLLTYELPQHSTHTTLGVEAETMLAEIFARVAVSVSKGSEATSLDFAADLDRSVLRAEMTSDSPSFDLAVVWDETGVSGLPNEKPLLPDISFLLVHRDPAALERFELESTRTEPLFWYSACPVRLPHGVSFTSVSSFRQALVNAAGGLGYAIIPAIHPALDVYRRGGLLAAKVLPEMKPIRITGITPPGRAAEETEVLREKISKALKTEVPSGSYLDGVYQGGEAADAKIPTEVKVYQKKSFHGYFLSAPDPVPVWDAQRITFDDVAPLGEREPSKAKAHSLELKSGTMINRYGIVFRLRDGLIGETYLLFLAAKDVAATKQRIKRVKPPRGEELKTLSPKEIERELWVQCQLPYCFTKSQGEKKFRVFVGFWIGKMRKEGNFGRTMINGLVMSEAPLSVSELNELYQQFPLQLCFTVGAAAWKGDGAYDTSHLSG